MKLMYITYQLDISYISPLPLAHLEDTTRIIDDKPM